MIKRIFNLAADIRITFYLLIAVAVIMLAGSFYTAADSVLFKTINGLRIQDWFLSSGIVNISKTWWLPLLFLSFGFLWLNLAACTAKRISVLWPRRKNIPAKQFVLFMIPSYVHLVFLVMLFAHFITFAFSEQRIIPIEEGTAVTLSEGLELRIKNIRHEYFPAGSRFKDSIKQSCVMFECNDKGTITSNHAGFLEPVCIDGSFIILDMKKKNRSAVPVNKMVQESNQSHKDHVAKLEAESPRMYLIVTHDPGLMILAVCFIQIIIAMGWYYFQINSNREINISDV